MEIEIIKSRLGEQGNPPTYVKIVADKPKSSVKVLSKPQTMLIDSTEGRASWHSVEKILKQELKPNFLKTSTIKLKKTKNSVVLTTKNDEDYRLLEEAIKNNEKLKDSLILRQSAKRRPKLILYSVSNR